MYTYKGFTNMVKFQYDDTLLNRRKKKILTLLREGKIDEANGYLWSLGFIDTRFNGENIKREVMNFLQDINMEMSSGNTPGIYGTIPASLNLAYHAGVRNI